MDLLVVALFWPCLLLGVWLVIESMDDVEICIQEFLVTIGYLDPDDIES